ncbi:transporter substrate-binding domain-containing protein [Pigmentibacter sp. JX0631]|uniref:substrate-binding periplasmic protein n=1 Tax=Pigmentibacter sp. JX0631 TaxID=2976982 RepID=UPI0024698B25|nr:transporter substrate-binding domain-containing protein [Pigmentibacter sp. JX0631]WGL61104.1 transporter substrate-binding domain-containing protein [Pigmentibacter sp. JX0631]
MNIIICILLLMYESLAFGKINICDSQKPISLGFYTIGFLFYEEDKIYNGIDYDVIEEIKKRTNCSFHTDVLTRARIWKELETGELNMSVSGIPTPERLKFAHFVRYLNAKQVLILNNKYDKILKLEELQNNPEIKFARVRAFKHGAYFDNMFENIKNQERIIEVPRVDDLFSLLEKNEVQAVVALNVVYPYWLQKLKSSNKFIVKDFQENTELVPGDLILSKKRFGKEDAEKFQSVIDSILKDGTLLKIFTKHVGAKIGKSLLPVKN